MSDKNSRFTGKIELPKLNLDLAEISGGGSCPSQFYGETTDGKEVYIRYRGGSLSIAVDNTTIYYQDFGPGLHGDILLEQICELTGITIKGQSVSISEYEFKQLKKQYDDLDLIDFSGRTLYWQQGCYWSIQGLGDFTQAVLSEIPNSIIIGTKSRPHLNEYMYSISVYNKYYDALNCDTVYLIAPPYPIETQYPIEDLSYHDLLETLDRFKVKIYLPGSFSVRGKLQRNQLGSIYGYYITYHDLFSRDIIIGAEQGILGAVFSAKNNIAKEFVEKTIEIFDRHFHSQYEEISLEDGKKIKKTISRDPYSKDFIDWCSKTENRFISLTPNNRAIRPFRR